MIVIAACCALIERFGIPGHSAVYPECPTPWISSYEGHSVGLQGLLVSEALNDSADVAGKSSRQVGPALTRLVGMLKVPNTVSSPIAAKVVT
jgi:hypothetical protein